MGSVEGDELRYDGGNRGASQEVIDAEDRARRAIAEDRVYDALRDGEKETLEWGVDIACDGMASAVRMYLMATSTERRDEALDEFRRICEHARKTLIDIKQRDVTQEDIAAEAES